jgi:YD repeat-containing protein
MKLPTTYRKTRLLSLLVALIPASVIFQCGSTPDPDPTAIVCFLSTEVYKRTNNPGYTFTATYTHTDGKLTKLVVRDSGQVNRERVTEMEYNSQGQIIAVTRSDVRYTYTFSNGRLSSFETFFEGKSEGHQEYQHNDQGQIIKAQRFNRLNTKAGYDLYEYVSTSGNQVKKVSRYSQSANLIESTEYEYDGKKNPYSDFPPFLIRRDIDWIGFPEASQNNIITKYTVDSSNDAVTTSYSYEYNDQGLPTKQTATAVYTPNGPTEIQVINYSYSCQ